MKGREIEEARREAWMIQNKIEFKIDRERKKKERKTIRKKARRKEKKRVEKGYQWEEQGKRSKVWRER